MLRPDPNYPTGTAGLIAVDKMANSILFLDPRTFEILHVLTGFQARVHELAISADHRTAYVPIYGDGRHGANPHPGHTIAVINLTKMQHVGSIDLSPYSAPHGIRWGQGGELYCVCENSGVVVEIDVGSQQIRHAIDVGSTNAHRIEVLPDGSKLYCENEEDLFATVLDLKERKRLTDIPARNGLAGIGLSPDGKTVVLVDGKRPELLVVDTGSDEVVRTIRLVHHDTAAQIARYSPIGTHLVVTSLDESKGTVLTSDFQTQQSFFTGDSPMDMAFNKNGRTVLVGNQGDGTITVVDLDTGRVERTIRAGRGIEVLSYY